ncbi:hypothetical protein, partial [Ilyobacter sp.]|uniref:hypothetical protein n=1 Tax=Ilyobacter sp. TaxID=3100343 RepID=UPI0035623AEA
VVVNNNNLSLDEISKKTKEQASIYICKRFSSLLEDNGYMSEEEFDAINDLVCRILGKSNSE